MEQAYPVEIKSDRQDLSVTLEKVTVKGESFSVNFQVNDGGMRNWDLFFFMDVARNDVTLVKESEKDIYDKPLKHSINWVIKN